MPVAMECQINSKKSQIVHNRNLDHLEENSSLRTTSKLHLFVLHDLYSKLLETLHVQATQTRHVQATQTRHVQATVRPIDSGVSLFWKHPYRLFLVHLCQLCFAFTSQAAWKKPTESLAWVGPSFRKMKSPRQPHWFKSHPKALKVKNEQVEQGRTVKWCEMIWNEWIWGELRMTSAPRLHSG